jgi:PAS domain-containing protein
MWLVLTCLVPGLVGVGVLFEQMYRNAREQTGKDTLLTARAMVLATDAELTKAQSVAVALATSSLLGAGDLQSFHGRAGALLRSEGIGANVVLSDARGRPLLDTLRPFGEPLPGHGNPEQLRRVFETARPAMSNVFVSGTTGKPMMTVDVPVVVDGNIVYVLSVVLAPQSFDRLLRSQDLPADWVSSITDRNGTTVARSKQADRLVGTQASPALRQHLLAASEGAFDTVTRDGVESVAAYSRSAASGWTVAIAVPQAALWAPWKRRLVQTGIGMFLLFALGCFLAWRQGGRIAVSVRRLTDVALAMQRDATPAIPPLHFAEAEIAAQAIQQSAQSLADRETARIEARTALHASQATLEAALGSMSDAVFICDTEGRVVEINEVFARFHRFADGQECPRTLADYPAILDIHRADGSWVPPDQWPVSRALRGDRGSNVRYRLWRKDTEVGWFASYSFAPIRSKDGSIVGAVVVGRDITEQEEREQSLAQTRARLGLAQRAAGAGLWDWDIAADTLAWSDEMFQLFGRDPLETGLGFDTWLDMFTRTTASRRGKAR